MRLKCETRLCSDHHSTRHFRLEQRTVFGEKKIVVISVTVCDEDMERSRSKGSVDVCVAACGGGVQFSRYMLQHSFDLMENTQKRKILKKSRKK